MTISVNDAISVLHTGVCRLHARGKALMPAGRVVQLLAGPQVSWPDTGPWEVLLRPDGQVVLQSGETKHRVALVVTGAFASLAERQAYASALARRFNAQQQAAVEDPVAPLQMSEALPMDADVATPAGSVPVPAPEAKYGCHCELAEGEVPGPCVIDLGQPSFCGHAMNGITRDSCPYWKIISTGDASGR